ncbi:ABC transporter permease [Isoptericola sp. b441]|uniref:ABC transporter permease n=1 Tax=Actinotalea lenta TaxID=3064654 RepID=A0ABT9D9C8_9CELL|nr:MULTISPECIES: ABC transporter permease [unclassified Isoptericola]MDO8107491.1 ABC transporter permease [Isoptericola sp. b441]MDO8120849.1 ABC transporter permease [Isoptericola sp. b490]
MTAGQRNAPAPAWRRVGAQAWFEVRAVLRNGEQLLITLVLPVLVLILLGRTTALGLGDDLAVVAPGVLALAVMSTGLTSQAIATAFDRRAGVLRLLATTPLGRNGLVAGKVVAVLVVEAGQVVVLGGVAMLLGWRPSGIPGAVLALALGTWAFVALGLLLAGTMRAEAVLGAANLLWVLLLVGGGVVVPPSRLPGPLTELAPLLPSGALGDALRSTLAGHGLPLAPLVVLVLWAAVLTSGVARTFRWS